MNKEERRRREDYQNAVEYLCAHRAELTDLLAGTEWSESLKALTAADPFSDPWYAAVRRLHDLVENNTDIIGGLGLTNPMGRGDWPGGDGGGKRIGGWACPREACTRIELDSGSDPRPPWCFLHAQPMTHVEV